MLLSTLQNIRKKEFFLIVIIIKIIWEYES